MSTRLSAEQLAELIRKAQSQPGLEDLDELSRIAAEAAQYEEFSRESDVLVMVSATDTNMGLSFGCPLGVN